MSKPTTDDDGEREERDDEEESRSMAILKSHAAQLAEHFDSVQIICTGMVGAHADETAHASFGEGNWYARVGSVRHWLRHNDK